MIGHNLGYKDRYGVEANALLCKVKYCRILKKTIRSKKRWFVQLVLEGKPLIKEKNKVQPKEKVGIDIGPSTIAVVSKSQAFLKSFCHELADKATQKKKLQQKISRSLRLNNPENFDEKGAVKKGAKKWVRSKRYNRLNERKAELDRKLTEQRKRLQGKLANETLLIGNQILMEKLSYKSLQKNYGKSVGARAPGLFASIPKTVEFAKKSVIW